MTNDIAQILSKYEGRETDDILDTPSLPRDIISLGNALNTAEPEEEKQGRQFLLKLLEAIDTQTEQLQQGQSEQKVSIDRIQKISDACIAYTKQKGK